MLHIRIPAGITFLRVLTICVCLITALVSHAATILPDTELTFSKDQNYVFPVAADPALLAWTQFHWDGGNAVDVEAAPELLPSDQEYKTVVSAPVVAVTAGIAFPLDNLRGGISVVLQGSDGRQYYYAHLRERRIVAPRSVEQGEVLGFVGSTGQWAQYLEPHLHFSIASGHHDGYMWETDIHAAQFFAEQFGLDWRHRDQAVYPPDEPHGWPFPESGRIIEGFAATAARNRDQAALLLAPPRPIPVRSREGGRYHRVPVIAPLGGMVGTSRDTPFGRRIQIVNEHSGHMVVLFGVGNYLARDGMTVRRGQLLGWIDPAETLRLQYFYRGRLTDYQPRLDSSRDLLE